MDRHTYIKWVVVILLIGVVINVPSLFTGFVTDDYPIGGFLVAHLFHLPGASGHWWDLFRFLDFVDSDATLGSIRNGDLVWWASPEIRIAFFRPLSVVTHYLDIILWPTHPELMHAHNIFYYIGILLGLSIYYRRVIGVGWVAILALFVFCVDDAHIATVGWIATRNTITTVFFAVWTLVSYDRWRHDRWRAGAYLTPVLFILALLSSEAAIGLWAHFLAYALFLDRSKRRSKKNAAERQENGDSDSYAISFGDASRTIIDTIRERAYRFFHLWPYLMITLVWRVLYDALGYGAFGSGFYTDPVHNPLRFIQVLPSRLLSAVGELFAIPTYLSLFAGSYAGAVSFWSSVVVFFSILWGVVPIVSGNREMKYWTTAAFLGCLPLCTTFPGSRVTLFCGIACFPLVAHFIAFLIRAFSYSKITSAARKSPRVVLAFTKPVTYALAVFFFILHLLVSPVYAFVFGEQLRLTADYIETHASFFPSGLNMRGKTLIVLNTPDFFSASMSSIYHMLDGKIHPERTLWIGATDEAIILSRPREDTLRLRVEGGYLREPKNTQYRDPAIPFNVGYQVNYATITITVEEITGDGRPKQIALKFPNINHPDLLFSTWKEHGYELIGLPPVGRSTVIPALDLERYFRLHFNALKYKASLR